MAYLYIIKVVVLPTATATFAKSNETFSVSQTPSVSSFKVEDIEEKSPNQKERNYFWESYYWYKYTLLSSIFGEILYPVWVQFTSFLWKIWEKNGQNHHCYIQNASPAAADISVNSLLQQK